jgi:hypothetical protein
VIPVVIHDRQIVDHGYDTRWCVDRAAAAGVTANLAILNDYLAFFQVLAGHPQAMADRV